MRTSRMLVILSCTPFRFGRYRVQGAFPSSFLDDITTNPSNYFVEVFTHNFENGLSISSFIYFVAYVVYCLLACDRIGRTRKMIRVFLFIENVTLELIHELLQFPPCNVVSNLIYFG